jgi:hypothetical protein
MYFLPDRFPDSPRPDDRLAGPLVHVLEHFGPRDRWVAQLIMWTGDEKIGHQIITLCRWFWSASHSLCTWCGLYHNEHMLTAERIRGAPVRIFEDRDFLPTYHNYCFKCIMFASCISVSYDTHVWCRGCMAWVTACEHLPFD